METQRNSHWSTSCANTSALDLTSDLLPLSGARMRGIIASWKVAREREIDNRKGNRSVRMHGYVKHSRLCSTESWRLSNSPNPTSESVRFPFLEYVNFMPHAQVFCFLFFFVGFFSSIENIVPDTRTLPCLASSAGPPRGVSVGHTKD